MKPSPTLLRACGRGNQSACDIAKRITALYAGAVVEFSEASITQKHPNKLPFSGTLLLVNQSSNKPPHGSQGHRIYVDKKVAEEKLDTLPGMAINYDPGDLDEHATRHKVGVITKAWLQGNDVKVSGFVWKKDFPESVKDLSKRKDLGMSMELADVYVRDEKESVWHLEDFSFTGATILKKDAAAYINTSLAAKAAAISEEGDNMKKPKEEKKKAAANRDTGQGNGSLALLAQAIGGQLTAAIGPLVSEMKASNERVMESLEETNGRLRLLEVNAAAEVDDDEDDEIVLNAAKQEDASDEEDDDDMAARKEEEESSDEEVAAAAKDDEGDSEDDSSEDDSSDVQAMEDLELEDASQEPGEVNKDASNRGDKKTVTKPPKQGEHFSGNVAKGRLNSAAERKERMKARGARSIDAAAIQISQLHASNRKLRKKLQEVHAAASKKITKLGRKVETMNAQLERFSDLEARRSAMPVELVNLASKAGVNLSEVKASGQKLSVQAVDEMFSLAKSQGINIEPSQRIAMKMLMEEQGILDQGIVDRGYGRMQ